MRGDEKYPASAPGGGREWVWRLRDGQPLGEDELAKGNIAQ
jgi:hypothetical protein